MKEQEAIKMTEKIEENIRFIKKTADYITENTYVLPMIIEQVALRLGKKPMEFLEELKEIMKEVTEVNGQQRSLNKEEKKMGEIKRETTVTLTREQFREVAEEAVKNMDSLRVIANSMFAIDKMSYLMGGAAAEVVHGMEIELFGKPEELEDNEITEERKIELLKKILE